MDIYGAAVFAVVSLGLMGCIYQQGRVIDSLVRAHAQERKDMVDRLMARDLTEVKQAQAMEDAPGPRAISKRSNEQRMAQEAKRMMEG